MAKYKVRKKDCQLIVKVKLSYREKLCEQELDFLSKKNIRGLLKAKAVKKNLLEYIGPIGISLYERLKKPISKYDFFFLIEQVVELTRKLNKNGLMIFRVVLDMKNVFINETTKEMQFMYLPLEKKVSTLDFMEFIKNIIYLSGPMLGQDLECISGFAYFINGLQRFDADKIEQYIRYENPDIVQNIKKVSVNPSRFITDKQMDYYAHYNNDEATELLNDEATSLLENDEATGLLENDEGTELLQDDEGTGLLQENEYIKFATLYRLFTNETININKAVFRIGKEKRYSDYFLDNNDKVSRNHADIITRGQGYYIIDLNSKNGTYINGKIIPAQQETEIFDGDHLRLANEEFIFHT